MTTQTPSKELQQAKRNQAFENKPLSSQGQCPAKALELAIFPVRYAIDESPAKGTAKGPNPLPQGWSDRHLPKLATRSYTLRQLRDGWLYVWNETDKTLHEYQVQGHQFIRHKWTDAQLNQDTRNNPAETRPYLLYPRRSRLRIAYSPVQWTWRLCEKMRSNPQEQERWMRDLDLSSYCTKLSAAHSAPLRELGHAVADILADGQAPSFQTCLLPTRPDDSSRPCKAAIDQAMVLGRVPDQDSALFIALDDPLAAIDDLAMNLQGRWLELNAADEQQRNKIESAINVQMLCGADLEPFTPRSVTNDPQRHYAFIKDANALLDAEANVRHHNGSDATLTHKTQLLQQAQAKYRASWGSPPTGKGWQELVEQWHDKRIWRADVKFDESLAYLHQQSAEQARLNAHIARSEGDLLAWLERLTPRPEEVSYDPCHAAQATELLNTMASLYEHLGATERGKDWLCEQYVRPTTLAGLALVNFNTELSELIHRVSDNFTRHGTIDDLGQQGDGSGQAIGGLSDGTSVATRANELKAVLDLPGVQRSMLYQALSEPAKRAFETLRQVVGQKAQGSWNLIAFTLLPALSNRFAPQVRVFSHSVTQVLFSTEISHQTQLLKDAEYPREIRQWQMDSAQLTKKISGQQGPLNRPGTPAHDRRAAQIQLAQLEAQRLGLDLSKPHEVTGAIATQTHTTHVQVQQTQHWLATLGQAELLEQLQLKAKNAAAYAARTHHWVNQNLGGSLPVLVAGLNLWNFRNTLAQAEKDGIFSADELRTIGANAAYTGNALMALWVVPAWNRWAKLEAVIGNRTTQLAKAGATAWLKAGQADFSRLAHKLVLRTLSMAALGAIAAGLEAWQVSKDLDKSTSSEEKLALRAKQFSLGLMTLISGAQIVGSTLGFWFSFAWVMSGPVAVLIAVLGVLYLLSSMVANHYKREGLRLWLHRCSWGKAPQWSHSDDDHKAAQRALAEICLRPSLLARATAAPLYDRGPRRYTGFWLQLLLPAELDGHAVHLQPAMIDRGWFEDDLMQGLEGTFYEQFLRGHWAPLDQLGQLPAQRPSGPLPGDALYAHSEQQRLWQVWIPYPRKPLLELEVRYPEPVLQSSNGRGYMFRLDLDVSADNAQLKSNTFSSEPIADMVLTGKATRLLPLHVPAASY
ncbi:hypothetical protein F3I16_01670 [Pseudomonas sp. L-22-4S-12]|uniref:T6SS effector BTH_I2691 family protein n=1 Tax=Pseudomonas sp. L-22-4S-12 TaxID=2610893 RepID=UPI0013206705|nr:T6SS effector BTH_I2691 family protein [Pseudomonas sp. L-22-4S-12]MWV14740.1 hypothetical protein [Pseudomonas sp. L-22-4S-12]